MERPRVLVADDEAGVRQTLAEILNTWGYAVETAETGTDAVALAERRIFDVALIDIRMPGLDGLQLLNALKELDGTIEVVLMTGNPMVSTAVQALKAGAYDYLTKPLNFDELQHLMGRLVEKRFLAREVRALRGRLGEQLTAKTLVGGSSEMARLKQMIGRIAAFDSPILIEGESGTGKELVAAAIHAQSTRASAAFVPVNCSAIPAELLESEFFGHIRGAFTGAVADALGLFRSADKGTLFLDEVGELPIALQAKLLRVLQEQMIRPVGGTMVHSVNVRVIAATNRDLDVAVRDGAFRQDLFYRLNVVRIHLPPLRERRDDIPALVATFVRQLNERFRRHVTGLSGEALAALRTYDFPGNVRELENMLERAFALGSGSEIGCSDLPALTGRAATLSSPVPHDEPLPTIEQAERDLIARALARFASDREQAARALGLTVRTLYRRIRKHRLA